MDDKTFPVKVFRRTHRVRAKMQLVVDVILDERHVVSGEQINQRLLPGIAKRHPGRIVERGHEPAGTNRMLLQRTRERIQIMTLHRIDRNLHYVQP